MSSDYIDITYFTNKRIEEFLNDDDFLIIRETLSYRSRYKPELYNIENVAKWAYYHFKRMKKSKIIFADFWEGFIIQNLEAVNELYTILTTKYNIPKNCLYYMSCCLHLPINLEKFNSVIEKYNYIPMKLMTTNNYEWFYGHDIEKHFYVYDKIDTSVRIKPKKFMCLNGIPRAGRISLVALLLHRNLTNQGYVSLVSDRVQEEANLYITDPVLINKFPKLHKFIYQTITNHANSFPMLQTFGLDHSLIRLRNSPRDHVVSDEDINLYNTSYFSVISETSHVAFEGTDPKYALFHDCYHFNEKTYRTMACKHPFILGHRPYALKALRDVGFKTFDPFIDESYDLIEDDEDRIIAMVNEVERLCSFSDEQWIEWQHNIMPIIEHNFNVLKNTKEFKIEGF